MIITSSSHLLGSKLGSEINQVECTIRMNDAPTTGYEADVGNKTSFRVVAHSSIYQVLKKPQEFVNKTPETIFIFWGPPSKMQRSLLRIIQHVSMSFPNMSAYVVSSGRMKQFDDLFRGETGKDRYLGASFLTSHLVPSASQLYQSAPTPPASPHPILLHCYLCCITFLPHEKKPCSSLAAARLSCCLSLGSGLTGGSRPFGLVGDLRGADMEEWWECGFDVILFHPIPLPPTGFSLSHLPCSASFYPLSCLSLADSLSPSIFPCLHSFFSVPQAEVPVMAEHRLVYHGHCCGAV